LFSEFSQDSDLLVVLTLMPKYVRLIWVTLVVSLMTIR
jgi:hypothetical protein